MSLKKICIKAIAVITAVFLIPVGVWKYTSIAPQIEEVAVRTAGLSAGNFDAFAMKKEFSLTATTAKAFEPDTQGENTVWDIETAPYETEIFSSDELGGEIYSAQPSEEVIEALPYPENLDGNDGAIEKLHYGTHSGEQYFNLDGGGQVRNCTDISNDELYAESLESPSFTLDKNSDEPQVLIYHTHATESFELEDKDYYDSSFTAKTTDPEKSIIAVGNEICQQLDLAGISYIHDTLVHDYPSYNASYESSRETVQSILEEYPSIKIVLDIHRDGIEREDGTRIAPVAEIDGQEAAQIMIIACRDDGTGNLPNCSENFKFACKLQSQCESMFEGLTRPILADYRFYNQDLSTGSLLIEIGSHGNSLEQVKYSGELLGKAIAEMFG